jgi:hypothetical protein
MIYFLNKNVDISNLVRTPRFTQFMLPMEKSVTLTGACANEIIPSINRLFVYKAKEGRLVRILLINGGQNVF